MKIGYNSNVAFVVQEMERAPQFEHIVVTDEIEISLRGIRKPFLINGAVQETITTEELTNRAIEIDLYYTDLITDLMRKHVEKYIDGLQAGVAYIIPNSVIEKRDLLRAECNQKIQLETGLNDYSYRQSVPKLTTK